MTKESGDINTSGGPVFTEEIRSRLHAVLNTSIPYGEDIALLDFPYSTNPGDCAIWLGEKQYLRDRNVSIRFQSDVGRYDADAIRSVHPHGPLLLHGGGNLGDLWPEHQSHRLQILKDFPDRDVVQLPQSVHFADPAEARRFSTAVRAHAHYRIFVRDEQSRRYLESIDVESTLSPDMAFSLGRLDRVTKPSSDVLILARTDHESGGLRQRLQDLADPSSRIAVEEWHMSTAQHARWSVTKTPHRIRRRTVASSTLHPVSVRLSDNFYDRMARIPFRAALKQLSRADFILTDRLHAHILATLLGIPHAIVDNSYGKLSGVYEAYTKSSGLAKMFDSVDDAIEYAGSR